MIAIIDYGSGNIAAIATILRRLNLQYEIVKSWERLKTAERYILPGVGHFGQTMSLMRETGLVEELHEQVIKNEKPLLGICVGMQLLADFSEEGSATGTGWIKGRVKKIVTEDPHVRLPHMGWNSVILKSDPLKLFQGVDLDSGFYFIHNYHFTPDDLDNVLALTYYGSKMVCAVSNNRNIFGLQFHPEKSHDNGIQIFKNFSAL
jgi:glutamine amidotransferase